MTGFSSKIVELNFHKIDTDLLLAVGGQQALGVDVEDTMRRPAPLEVAGHSFSPFEESALHALPEDLQAARFFHYWTLKEAYIKAKS